MGATAWSKRHPWLCPASAPAPLLGARLTAPGDASRGSVRPAGRPAIASGARASRFQVAEPHWYPTDPSQALPGAASPQIRMLHVLRGHRTGCRPCAHHWSARLGLHGPITGSMPVAGLGRTLLPHRQRAIYIYIYICYPTRHEPEEPAWARSPLGDPREPSTLARGLSSAALCKLQAIGALCARSCASRPRPTTRRRAL